MFAQRVAGRLVEQGPTLNGAECGKPRKPSPRVTAHALPFSQVVGHAANFRRRTVPLCLPMDSNHRLRPYERRALTAELGRQHGGFAGSALSRTLTDETPATRLNIARSDGDAATEGLHSDRHGVSLLDARCVFPSTYMKGVGDSPSGGQRRMRAGDVVTKCRPFRITYRDVLCEFRNTVTTSLHHSPQVSRSPLSGAVTKEHLVRLTNCSDLKEKGRTGMVRPFPLSLNAPGTPLCARLRPLHAFRVLGVVVVVLRPHEGH